MLRSIITRLLKSATITALTTIGAFAYIAITPQAALALPGYGYCTSCHPATAGVTITVIKTAETAIQASYSVSGSTANSRAEGWAVFNSSQAKIASGNRAGSFVLPRDGQAYTVIWVDPASNLSGATATTVVTTVPLPPPVIEPPVVDPPPVVEPPVIEPPVVDPPVVEPPVVDPPPVVNPPSGGYDDDDQDEDEQEVRRPKPDRDRDDDKIKHRRERDKKHRDRENKRHQRPALHQD